MLPGIKEDSLPSKGEKKITKETPMPMVHKIGTNKQKANPDPSGNNILAWEKWLLLSNVRF